jgi:glycerol-3-phosphate dehydrogenase (NAD(P)+)
LKISVIGAGSWGTAMSSHLAYLGNEVSLWAREPEVAQGINLERRNPLYLSDVALAQVRAVDDINQALRGAELVIMAVPSRWCGEVARQVRQHLGRDVPVVNLAKGFDYESGRRLSEVIGEALGDGDRVAALSGPNHAEEVARKIPSATVIASSDQELSSRLQEIFSAQYFRVYTNSDVIGVEVGGAYKNIVAIAA